MHNQIQQLNSKPLTKPLHSNMHTPQPNNHHRHRRNERRYRCPSRRIRPLPSPKRPQNHSTENPNRRHEIIHLEVLAFFELDAPCGAAGHLWQEMFGECVETLGGFGGYPGAVV